MTDSSRLPVSLLVVGYGNTLRGDDAAGQRVAEAIGGMNLTGVEVIATHQLTPELAEAVAGASRVVFVDASALPQEHVELRRIEPESSGRLLAHAASPTLLLAMARELYASSPTAWWLTIPVAEMDFGESLSPVAERGVADAVARIRELAAKPDSFV